MQTNTSAAATLAVAETLSSSELNQARLFLDEAHNGVAGAIKGLSEAQWTYKPAPGRWSIAEIVEHIIFVQDRVLGPLREQLAAAPAPSASRDNGTIDAIVINQFPSRLKKFQAPEFAHPRGGLELSDALRQLTTNRARTLEYLESSPDLRSHVVDAAPLKAVTSGGQQTMDGYQWILAASAHAARHTKQILEVMAEAGFPKG